MRGTPREVVLAEVEHMLSFGEPTNRIAEALGIKPGSVARSLSRSGRPDLAAKFERTRSQSESHACKDCGATISRKVYDRCRPCGYAERERRRDTNPEGCPREGCARWLNDAGRCRVHGWPVAA